MDRHAQDSQLTCTETSGPSCSCSTFDNAKRMESYTAEGMALELEVNVPEIRYVAARIRDGSDQIIAAISMTATSPHSAGERLLALVSVMGSTIAQISRRLEYSAKTF